MNSSKFLQKISRGIVKGRIIIVILFVAMLAAFAVCSGFVNINYDDTYYLPEESNTKLGLESMEKSFGAFGNASAMIKDASVDEILNLKGKIENTDGVASVIWVDGIFMPMLDEGLKVARNSGTSLTDAEVTDYILRAVEAISKSNPKTARDILNILDDEFNLYDELGITADFQRTAKFDYRKCLTLYRVIKTLDLDVEGYNLKELNLSEIESVDTSFLDKPMPKQYKELLTSLSSQLSTFYKDDCALFQIMFTNDDYSQKTSEALENIDNLSDKLYLTGNAATTYYSQQSQMKDILIGMGIAIVIVLAILFAFSSSWFEPLLYVFTIGVAVVINLGSNIFMPNVSYMTNSVSCILQLVLSMDYAIVLISRYKREKKLGKDKKRAAADALSSSIFPIAASSLTTIACFITIMFMDYKIGLDMGIVMTKGIVLSLLTVFLLLPGLIVMCDKPIMQGEHKTFHISFNNYSKFLYKLRFVIPILAIAIVIPSFFAQNNNTFTYGVKATQGEDSTAIVNLTKVEEVFGTQEQLVLLVPADYNKELELSNKLINLNEEKIASVNSYPVIKESGFDKYLPKAFISQFKSGNRYDRILLSLNAEEEGKETKALLNKIEKIATSVYKGEKFYLLGNTAAAVDMEESTNSNFTFISIISLAVVAVVIFSSYQSLIIAVILIAIIEGGIFINMAIPYLMHQPICFMGYMIISNILLGATIDYGIIMTSNYMEAREEHDKKEALRRALSNSFRPLLISAGIFTLGGLVLGIFMSSAVVRMLGMSIMRGGICSFVMTMVVLPTLLVVLDKPVNMWHSFIFRNRDRKRFNERVIEISKALDGIDMNNLSENDLDKLEDLQGLDLEKFHSLDKSEKEIIKKVRHWDFKKLKNNLFKHKDKGETVAIDDNGKIKEKSKK